MAVSLTPGSSGELAAAIDRVIERQINDVQVEIATSLDPARCRASLLPWLAYHRGIDIWFSDWTEEQKRAVIRDAIPNFRRRGTLSGLVAALDNFVNTVEIIEWWEIGENGTPGTFRVNVIGAALESISAQNAIADVVKRTSPYTRQGAVTVENQLASNILPAVGVRIALMLNADSKQKALRP